VVVEHVRTDVADKVVEETLTTAGLGVQLGPEGETSALRLMVPTNPFALVTVIIVDESDDPAGIVKDV